MLSMCRAISQRESSRRITYSEIHVQNINYLPTIQYSIRDCKIRQIIALVANRDSRYCGSAIAARRTALCGINNLIIRNTEFTIEVSYRSSNSYSIWVFDSHTSVALGNVRAVCFHQAKQQSLQYVQGSFWRQYVSTLT